MRNTFGGVSDQFKTVSEQMKQEMINSVATAYEPLLERHIGRKVVLELVKGDRILEFTGVLKAYTSEFIEIMDVDYSISQADQPRKADIVTLRNCGIVRHLAE